MKQPTSTGYEINSFIKEESQLIKRTGESKSAKKIMDANFKLSDTCNEIISLVKGIKLQIPVILTTQFQCKVSSKLYYI